MTQPIQSTKPKGQLVCVLGPSGAGKDSLVTWLMAHWPGPVPLHWARRSITRAADAGGEPHEALTEEAFQQVLAQDGFAVHWAAHGLHYGVRREELQALAQGGCVLLNGSRAHLPQAVARHPDLAVLHVTASPATLRARLMARQRETEADIHQRVLRTQGLPPLEHPCCLTLHNDGTLAEAGAQALAWLQSLLGPAEAQTAQNINSKLLNINNRH